LYEEYFEVIDILCIQPDRVYTKQEAVFGDNWYLITVDQLLNTSLAQLGKSFQTFPHWTHAVRDFLHCVLVCRCCVRKEFYDNAKKNSKPFADALAFNATLKAPWSATNSKIPAEKDWPKQIIVPAPVVNVT